MNDRRETENRGLYKPQPAISLGAVLQELARLQERCSRLEEQVALQRAAPRLYWPGDRPHVQFEIDP